MGFQQPVGHHWHGVSPFFQPPHAALHGRGRAMKNQRSRRVDDSTRNVPDKQPRRQQVSNGGRTPEKRQHTESENNSSLQYELASQYDETSPKTSGLVSRSILSQ